MKTLRKKLKKYVHKTDKLYLPYLWETWGIEPHELSEALVSLWDSFPNPRMVDNILHLNVQEEPEYYEVCNDKRNRGTCLHKDALWGYCYHNNKPDQHISVFTHDRNWIQNYQRTGSVSCRGTTIGIERIYLELDRPTLKEAIEDAKKIYRKLIDYKDQLRFWYSGNNSIHIEVNGALFGRPMGKQNKIAGHGRLAYNLAHKLAGDIRNEIGVVDPWSLKSQELKELHKEHFGETVDHIELHILRQKFETIDPNLFSTNSLIRQPYSIHEKRGMMKVPIPIEELDGAGKKKFPKKRFDFGGNYPYLIHWIYDCYEEKRKKKTYEANVDEDEVIELFTKTFEYFDPREANEQGWVNALYSPFYKDTNPSVSVNIESGFYKDFGQSTHAFTFEEFKRKLNESTKR